MYIEYVVNIGVQCSWKPQLEEAIIEQEIIAVFDTHGGTISLDNLEHLPQNFTQYNCTTMLIILRISNKKRCAGPKI